MEWVLMVQETEAGKAKLIQTTYRIQPFGNNFMLFNSRKTDYKQQKLIFHCSFRLPTSDLRLPAIKSARKTISGTIPVKQILSAPATDPSYS